MAILSIRVLPGKRKLLQLRAWNSWKGAPSSIGRLMGVGTVRQPGNQHRLVSLLRLGWEGPGRRPGIMEDLAVGAAAAAPGTEK